MNAVGDAVVVGDAVDDTQSFVRRYPVSLTQPLPNPLDVKLRTGTMPTKRTYWAVLLEPLPLLPWKDRQLALIGAERDQAPELPGTRN